MNTIKPVRQSLACCFIGAVFWLLPASQAGATLANAGVSGTQAWPTPASNTILSSTTVSNGQASVIDYSSTGFDLVIQNNGSTTGNGASIRSNIAAFVSSGGFIRFLGTTPGTFTYAEIRANQGIFDLTSIKLGTADGSSSFPVTFTITPLDSSFNPITSAAATSPQQTAQLVAGTDNWITFTPTGATQIANFTGIYGVRIVQSSGIQINCDAITVNNPRMPSSPPTVTTPTSASITGTGATLGGNVTSDGGAAITERGVVFAKTSDDATPTLGEPNVTSVTTSGTTGVFTLSSGTLLPGTAYSFAAYATNSAGTSYSSVSTFATLGASGPYQWTNFVGLPGGWGNADGTGAAARFFGPWGMTADASGNIYVADSYNHLIRKMTPAGAVTTLAGGRDQNGLAEGYVDGTGSAARFAFPAGLVVDSSGNALVADMNNHAIRKITPAGVVTTLAGGSGSGSADGTGSAAKFNRPQGIALDGSGNLYVADTNNHTIRKVTSAGVVTTLAGTATLAGSTNATGAAARFNQPMGIVFEASSGNLYVCDRTNGTIRQVTLAGAVTTFAGQAGSLSTVNGTGAAARFNSPLGICLDPSGNLFVVDDADHVLRKITPSAVVTTLAGDAGVSGTTDGTGTSALFAAPSGVVADSSGNLYVSCYASNTIRKVTPAGVVTTIAGEPDHLGSDDGTGTVARFNYPLGVRLDNAGNLYVADGQNNTIRKVTPEGVVTTLAGSAGEAGLVDGTGSAARFGLPTDMAVDSSGNLFLTEGNSTVRKITSAGVVTTIAGAPFSGYVNGTGSAVRFFAPNGIVMNSAGDLFVVDNGNNAIRKVTQAGMVTTFAGSLTGAQGGTDGTGTAALFNGPYGVAIDGSDNLYVTDAGGSTIRKITPAGVVTTIAGSYYEFDTVDGIGSAARFAGATGISCDGSGNLYLVEISNTVRKVTPAGVVTTIGGTPGVTGGADGIGAAAQFSFDFVAGAITSSPSGTLYVSDHANHRIVKGTIASATPTVTTPTSTSITGTGATLGGNVTSDGGATITGRGVVYSVTSTNSNPQIGGTGVSQSSTTGTTGVFTVSSGTLTPGTAYSFAAYATNSAGTSYSSVGTFTTLSANGDLNALAFSAGTITFAAGTTSYSFSVPNATASTTTTATKADANATLQVQVNGSGFSALTSGSPSGSLSLNVGANSVDVKVTAQDGTTTKTYTTTITRAVAMSAPTVTAPTGTSITGIGATLGGNVISDGGAAITERGVVFAKTADDSTPTLGEPNVASVTTSGTTGVFTLSSGTLLPGTVYSFAAYATNAAGTTYTSVGTFTTLSNNAKLAALALSSGTLAPVFASLTTGYAVTVPRSVATMTATPTAADSNATLQVRLNGGSYASVTSGSPSGSLPLDLGSNSIYVFVTAQDGTTTEIYTVVVTRWTYLQGWRNQYFGTIDNTGNAADTATPQNDGIANLMKFALGMNPLVNGLQPTGIVKNGGTLEFTYPRSVEATVECTFIVEWSDTLMPGSWDTAGVSEQILSDNGTLQQVKATLPAGSGVRRFVRLQVMPPEVIE